jgi:hypothetical protein
VAADVEAIKDSIRNEVRRIAEDARDLTVEVVKGVAPVGETGVLADSVTADDVVETGDGVFTTVIRCTAPYASFTDTGTAEFVQEGSPLLSFEWADGPGDRSRFAFRSVTHPAQPGTNWFSEPMPDVWESAVSEVAS